MKIHFFIQIHTTFLTHMYISIAGLIGVSKITMATRLSELYFYKCRVYEEGLSKYLDDFQRPKTIYFNYILIY